MNSNLRRVLLLPNTLKLTTRLNINNSIENEEWGGRGEGGIINVGVKIICQTVVAVQSA